MKIFACLFGLFLSSLLTAGTAEIKTQAAAFYAAAQAMGLGGPAGASKTSRVMEVLKPGK